MNTLRLLVSFKVTPDFEALRESDWVAGAAGVVETRYARRVLNCFDESALELALRLKETLAARDVAASVGALSVGGRETEPYLRTLLALGYEKVARVEPPAPLDFAPAATATIIAGYVRRVDDADLLLLGCRSGPGDSGVVPFLVAEELRRSCVTQVTELEPLSDGRLRVTGAADGGSLRLTARTPCVLAVGNAVVSHLRVPTLTARLATRGEEPAVLSIGDLGLDVAVALDERSVAAGLQPIDRRRRGIVIEGDTPQGKARVLFDTYLRNAVRKL